MKKLAWALVGALTVLILGAVAVGALYLKNNDKFFSGTMINSMDCTSKTVAQVETELLSNIEDAGVHITGRNGLETSYTADELGVSYSFDNRLNEALADSQALSNLFRSKNYQIEYTLNVDDAVLKEQMKQLMDSQEIYDSKDAEISYSRKKEKYVIKPEVYGTYFDLDAASALVKEALHTGNTEVNLEECYLSTPEVLADDKDLVKRLKELNRYMITITLDFSDRQETINASMIQKWMNIAEDGSITYDETAMREYLHEISQVYDTYARTRKFTTHDGRKIKVGGGSYGWMIHNGDTIARIIEAIEGGENVTIEPAYSFRGYVRDKDDIGDSYIEISLKEQHVWVYIDGELKVSTDCVTGNSSRGYDTPTGIYPINYLERDATLEGENYSSPVSYWMPFNGNVGLHDASWRSSFGGEIYKYSGSHGCVNLPSDKAKQIFESIEPGMPVIVYNK